MLAKTLNCLLAGRSLGHHLHVRLIVDQSRNALAHQGVIVDTQNTNTYVLGHLRRSSFDSAMVRPLWEGYNFVAHLQSHGGETVWNANFPGIRSWISVPAFMRLSTSNVPPIFSARSRILARPQCPSRPVFNT